MSPEDATLVQAFEYRGWSFLCRAQAIGNAAFRPVAICVGEAVGRQTELPRDADAYSTVAEALQHAQAQAVQWVHEHDDCRGRE